MHLQCRSLATISLSKRKRLVKIIDDVLKNISASTGTRTRHCVNMKKKLGFETTKLCIKITAKTAWPGKCALTNERLSTTYNYCNQMLTIKC